MHRARIALAALALFAARPSIAADTGSFLVRLGSDTTSVERYTRTPAQLKVEQVGRAPRVMGRSFTYDFDAGVLTHMRMVVTPPAATTPTQTVDIVRDGDSLTVNVQTGTAPVRISRMGLPRDGMVITNSSPWTAYETQVMRLVASKADSLHVIAYYLGSEGLMWFGFRRLDRDSVAIYDEHGSLYHARVDVRGQILGVLPIAGTAKFSVARVEHLDFDGLRAGFVAREQAAGVLGALSPRDTLRTTVGGAALWVDYGRPGKRGREIFGNVVPYGEVWRTGANAATQFRTDRALDFGGTVVPAGFYTLWTIPTASGWKLVVNGETGQWGTEHHADKDLFTIPMRVTALPEAVERFTIAIEPTAGGGELRLDWDTTRAAASFTLAP